MNEPKQKLLLEYLISSSDIFSLCAPILKSEYFDAELRFTVDFILTYYNLYNATPSIEQIAAETSITLQAQIITKDKTAYCADEVETFCKQRAIQLAIIKCSELEEKHEYGEMERVFKEASMVSLNRNMGLDYFKEPEKRLELMLTEQKKISTGYKEFDEHTNGGIARKELLLITANTGGGKSLTMGNLALNLVDAGYNVLVFSLEMDENVLAQRLDSMITGISSAIWQKHVYEIATKVEQRGEKSGHLQVVQLLGGANAREMESYIKLYQLKNGFLPDILIVDYIDIMGTNQKVPLGDVFLKDKCASEEIRNLGVVYNMAVISASQQNREAIKATHINQSHIAGGISKANTCDIWISVIFSEQMKAQGIIKYHFIKTRNSGGQGKTFELDYNNDSLRITDKSNPNGLPPLKKKGSLATNNDIVTPTSDGIMDSFQI